METFYFGDAPKQLYAVYHPAGGANDRGVGVVLCYPIINEYLRSHRAFVRLATQLATAGFHVLRFDYYGCGDSYGADDDASLETWSDNLASAIDELKQGCDAAHICLVGLRVGASLALLVAQQRDDIDSMVLWEPIVDGAAYLREIKRLHLESAVIEGLPKAAPDAADGGRQLELLGFTIPQALCDELLKLDLLALPKCPARRILLLENSDDYDRREFVEHLRRLGCEVEPARIDCPSIWLEGDNESYAGLVPVDALDRIIDWISEAHA